MPSASQASAAGPLAGIRVLELGQLIAAPFATKIMAEFGAEVIKVEAPRDGDPLRRWRKMHEGTSLWWYTATRKKFVFLFSSSRSRDSLGAWRD